MAKMQRAGQLKKNLSGEAAYESFLPSPLPPKPTIEVDEEMLDLLVDANKQLSALKSVAGRVPTVNLLISMYVRKEALLSSQIEGTQATLEDVLDPFVEENANADIAEVVNYIKATEFAIERLKEFPLCNRLIRDMHYILLEGARGQEKNPGLFRYTQNWIGPGGCTLQNASYIPPSPVDMEEAMSDLEKYMNQRDSLDILIRAALIHYQFETIHPFLDGNGRVGRLLVTLFLIESGALDTPALYISYFLKQNRMEYYERMTEVRRKGNYEQWVKFFLRAISVSALDATETIYRLTALHDQNRERIAQMGRGAKTTERLFAYLEENPIIEIQKTATALELSYNTVSGAVKRLLEAGILIQSAGKQRNRIFSYEAYLEILKEGTT